MAGFTATNDVFSASTFNWDMTMTATGVWKVTFTASIDIHKMPCLEVLTDYGTFNPYVT